MLHDCGEKKREREREREMRWNKDMTREEKTGGRKCALSNCPLVTVRSSELTTFWRANEEINHL